MAGRESNTVIRRYQAPLSFTHISFVNGKKVTEKVKLPLCDPVQPVPNSVVADPGISNQAIDSTRNQISSDACALKTTSTTLTRVRTKFTEEQLAKMKRLVDDGVIKRTTAQESKIIIDMATELNLEPKIVKVSISY